MNKFKLLVCFILLVSILNTSCSGKPNEIQRESKNISLGYEENTIVIDGVILSGLIALSPNGELLAYMTLYENALIIDSFDSQSKQTIILDDVLVLRNLTWISNVEVVYTIESEPRNSSSINPVEKLIKLNIESGKKQIITQQQIYDLCWLPIDKAIVFVSSSEEAGFGRKNIKSIDLETATITTLRTYLEETNVSFDYYGDIACSPNESKIAFVRNGNGSFPLQKEFSDLVIYNYASDDLSYIHKNNSSDQNRIIDWSLDGRWLVDKHKIRVSSRLIKTRISLYDSKIDNSYVDILPNIRATWIQWHSNGEAFLVHGPTTRDKERRIEKRDITLINLDEKLDIALDKN